MDKMMTSQQKDAQMVEISTNLSGSEIYTQWLNAFNNLKLIRLLLGDMFYRICSVCASAAYGIWYETITNKREISFP